MKGVFVTATDTGVGKTVLCLLLAIALKERGINALCMKPFSSGGRRSHDAFLYKKYISPSIPFSLINPVHYYSPLSPFSASLIEGRSADIEKVIEAYKAMSKEADFLIVEGIGGLLVPIRKDYFLLDFMKELSLPFILVIRPGLGTLNHTFLSLNVAEREGLLCKGIVMNHTSAKREDIAMRTNLEVFKLLGREIILKIPYKKGLTRQRQTLLSLLKELPIENLIKKLLA